MTETDKEKFGNSSRAKQIILCVLVIALLVTFDQITKHAASAVLKDHDAFVLIPGVLELRYLENTGAAFSMMAGRNTFHVILLVLTPVVCALMMFIIVRLPVSRRYALIRWDLAVLFAGAAGNYIDRVLNGYVVDFIYFSLINFPVFNVADIYVTLSVIFLFILILFVYSDREIQTILHGEKNSSDATNGEQED